MYLAPVILQAWDTTLSQLWIFLERNGGHLIEVASEEEAKQFLIENELTKEPTLFTSPSCPEILFTSISPNTEGLSAFYSWREVAVGSIPAKETWRNFLWTNPETLLGVNSHLSQIQISPTRTVYDILKAFHQTDRQPQGAENDLKS